MKICVTDQNNFLRTEFSNLFFILSINDYKHIRRVQFRKIFNKAYQFNIQPFIYILHFTYRKFIAFSLPTGFFDHLYLVIL